jgi:hypothetical protein
MNAQPSTLTPAQNSLSKDKCPATCPQGQQCIKKADGFLDCRATATGCDKDCKDKPGTVCVKATPTAAAGTCVTDAPASAKVQSNPKIGGVASPDSKPSDSGETDSVEGSTNPTGIKEGLEVFRGAGSGLNIQGTLIAYIANIIRWILGILGTVFFLIIVFQGYTYMTAGGDSGKTASAVGAIGNAVVGLLIIMGAFLITNFVTSALIFNGGGS